ncbi:MAG: hypothetical protein RJB62_1062 [Pseudomonadota bacterium]
MPPHFTGKTIVAAAFVLAATLMPASAEEAQGDTYTHDEIVQEAADFFQVGAEAVAAAVEHIFAERGYPNAYIAGTEGSGAIGIGLRYGEGTLNRKNGPSSQVYWQGPSIGFDLGANASKVFTLIYNLPDNDAIYQRFPGVEGSYYFIAGIGVNYQQAGDIILAPMRTGVGLRAGANVGYLSYTREREILPF